VASLKRLEYPDWECIIIAGGRDGTLDYAQAIVSDAPHFRVLSQRAGGKNAALNDGLGLARGSILVLLDADCEVEPAWLSSLVAPVITSADASLGNYSPDLVTPISLQFEMNKISTYFVRGATTLHGGAIAISRTAIDKLGGSFPEAVVVGTDWDLNIRLEQIGARKVFVPEARHKTPLPSTWSQFVKNEIRWRRAHFTAVLRFWSPRVTEWVPGLMSLVPYAVGILSIGVPASIPLLYFLHPVASFYVAWGWALYLVWALGRRVGQVIEVATYSGDRRWLSLFWVPPATLFVSLCCCVLALISLQRASPHFKGHRPQSLPEEQHGSV
jgi:cellulose synthase/poly-beta-1,6-N-acetylglucosamine synthase-like glycosyltransferase